MKQYVWRNREPNKSAKKLMGMRQLGQTADTQPLRRHGGPCVHREEPKAGLGERSPSLSFKNKKTRIKHGQMKLYT